MLNSLVIGVTKLSPFDMVGGFYFRLKVGIRLVCVRVCIYINNLESRRIFLNVERDRYLIYPLPQPGQR